VRVYPHRANVPHELSQQLLGDAEERIAILVYAGMWLPDQNPRLSAALRRKAAAGAAVRILLGDPDSAEVAMRGAEEGFGDALAGKVRNAVVHYRDLAGAPNAEVRLHATTLYASIYRFDNHLLANAHVSGFPAAQAPSCTYAGCPPARCSRRIPTASPRCGRRPDRSDFMEPASMGQRIDYLDDPNAPKANSIVPSVNVVVTDDEAACC
jgi:hypothetical protein